MSYRSTPDLDVERTNWFVHFIERKKKPGDFFILV
jgi:hypothetical protein